MTSPRNVVISSVFAVDMASFLSSDPRPSRCVHANGLGTGGRVGLRSKQPEAALPSSQPPAIQHGARTRRTGPRWSAGPLAAVHVDAGGVGSAPRATGAVRASARPRPALPAPASPGPQAQADG